MPRSRAGDLLSRIGMRVPIIQSPMAGVSTAAMAAAVSQTGGLGSLGIGAMTAEQARTIIREFRALSDGPLNVNLFVHQPAKVDPGRDLAWLERLAPEFGRWGRPAPTSLREIYPSFLDNIDMLEMLVAERPRVVSFHFGLPHPAQIDALHRAGAVLLASATNLDEARAVEAAGIDAVVAQGFEAGGHRGVFDPDVGDSRLTTVALTRLLARSVSVPVIAAGGIMDGAGVAAAVALGACAVQMGTAFLATDESLADAGFRTRLQGSAAHQTVMTRVISGRPARSLSNDFTRWGETVPDGVIPDYPIAYDAGKALNAIAKAAGNLGYGADWAGQGAPLVRAMSTQQLMSTLIEELRAASAAMQGRTEGGA
ncbi:NAD(P)H-dependent flavin oxidoreductase [Lysobacter sp. TAF61]|uniref:NAD(P)H-dependent flavin oxidoreductase n=1 Tax=Lysobacter sp. TAF61 TaxID=3233072 RepID=UPI003F988C0A